MTDARWSDAAADLAAACRHFANAAKLFEAGGFEAKGLDGYRAEMALQHAMQSGYTSLEGMLVRILEILGEEAPSGSRWHTDLIRRVSQPLDLPDRKRPAILDERTAKDVDEARRFRHRATHDYDSFEARMAAPALEAAKRLSSGLPPQIAAFRKAVDPDVRP